MCDPLGRCMEHSRVKPTKALRDATHAAQEVDYSRLAQAVVEHIIHRKKDIYLRFPYFATFAEGWPRGILYKKDGIHDIFKCKTYKIADFLYQRGFLPYDAKGIMKGMRDWGYREARLTRMLTGEISVDCEHKNVYNDGSVVEDEKEGE